MATRKAAGSTDLSGLPDRPPKKDSQGNDIRIRMEDLKEGDVLLSYGTPAVGGISWWIRTLDKSWYSHASYFDGEVIVDATTNDVLEVEVAERMCQQAYVDVFRFRSDQGDELGSDGWPPGPVTEAVKKYLGHEFAMYDLVFIAALLAMRRVDLPDSLELKARWILSRGLLALRQLIFREKKIHFTCVELIYRGFREAESPPNYRLSIPVRNPDAGIPAETIGPPESGPDRRFVLEDISMDLVRGSSDEDLEARFKHAVEVSHLNFPELTGLPEIPVDENGSYHGEALVSRSDGDIGNENLPSLEELSRVFEGLYAAHKGGDISPEGFRVSEKDYILPPEPISDFVSLFDVENSPNLVLLGRAWRDDYGCS